MSLDVFTFDKTCQERLEEFRDILCSRNNASLLASCVFNEWKQYLQFVVEPCGWQAIWKISAARCKELKIKFPALAIVKVENVDFSSLCATVKVVAVQDEFNLPAVNQVPLQQLFPTQDQREDYLELERTACALDNLRFFISNVWRPWDSEDGTYDWVGEHLASRLQLHEDICKGTVLPKTGKQIRALVREGRELQLQIDNLCDENIDLPEDSAFGDCSVMEISDDEKNEQTLVELEARKQMIIAELAMLENPIQRSLIESRQSNKAEQRRRQKNTAAPEACFVWLRGPARELIDSLDRAREFITGDTLLKCVESAQDALEESLPGDTVLLCAGQHSISCAGGLATGGVLRGESQPTTIVVGLPHAPTMLDFSPRIRKVSLFSLTLRMGAIQLGILLQEGTLSLENCHLHGDSKNDTQRGIVVMPGANLVAKNCNFFGFGTTIDVHKDGRLEFYGCLVTQSSVGIQVEKGALISLAYSQVTHCTVAGVKLLEHTMENTESSGKTEKYLDGLSEFKMETVSFVNNGEDVLVAAKRHPIEGLYDEEDVF